MQMNLLRKVSLLEFRAASSSDAVKPTPSARIGFGRAGAAGHRRTTRLESSVRNLGGLAIAKAKRGVGRGHSSGEAGQCPWVSPERQRVAKRCPSRGAKGLCVKKGDDANQMARRIMSKDCNRGQSAMWRRVGNRSTAARNIRWNQCETRPQGIGERDQ